MPENNVINTNEVVEEVVTENTAKAIETVASKSNSIPGMITGALLTLAVYAGARGGKWLWDQRKAKKCLKTEEEAVLDDSEYDYGDSED